jgi:hypothetical protein
MKLAEKSSVFSSSVDGQISLKVSDGSAGCDIPYGWLVVDFILFILSYINSSKY